MTLLLCDMFVTYKQLNLWYHDYYYCNDDRLIRWFDGYKKRRAQKAKIKKQLMPIAWNPGRVMDWCISEEKKRLWK